MQPVKFDVVIGGDDEQVIQLLLDGTAQVVTALQNITVVFPDGIEIKSSVEPTLFDWVSRSGENIIVLTLGQSTNTINTGSHYPVKLFIFDAARPNGLLWDSVRMNVSMGATP